ncbi:alpha/beta hydrolase [Corynebacterium aquatimens]|uniref:Acyl-CoA:diacylglycerol acyltransferase n=1 Tax=Corynebacterium aquatimens TaxID=1190508 RepID=A0A931GSA5_9CORY|nr:alpha/beta hydrolase family protein [Corynebacterium aquatimens]MBG6122848.1 diacylglycerol O-acyltransferase/trehalose O-mycolyltransferase [Corynebacterium aquatimens]WJY66817.1 Diacylglycerol acyltransferase/mycolyltransferase Ag85C precursor [Corynebacterium aquatimens]
MTATRSARRSAIAIVAALAALLMMFAAPQEAEANPRGWLRPDATGKCEWDRTKFWVQRCDVFSPAMGRNITMQIVPATRGGNAGLYLLDGLRATNRSNAWLVDTNAARIYENTNITLVMPVGGEGSFYADWFAPAKFGNQMVNYKWETFLTKELPPYLQRHFGVAPNNNSIAGLSMGGTAAMNLAAKYPQQFRQVLSFSGYLTTTLPGMQTMLRVALLDAGGYNLNAMWGPVVSPLRFENDPFLNMNRLRNTSVYVSAATGVPAPNDGPLPLDIQASATALEAGARATTRIWEAKARAEGLNPVTDYPSAGLHNWNQFGSQLAKTKPLVLNHMRAW